MKTIAYRILFLWLSVTIVGCTQSSNNCAVDADVLAINDSILSNKIFKEQLKTTMNFVDEPLLHTGSTKSYRLSVFHSFSEGTWIYRCTPNRKGGELMVKKKFNRNFMDDNAPSYDTTYVKQINALQWAEIETSILESCFWTMPFEINRRGLDGTTFLLEAFNPNNDNPTSRKYHAAIRWSPPDSTKFRQICTVFEKLE